MIEVNHLTKYYGEHPAVRDISFELQEKEALGVLGLNGAGKTTILRILAGFLIPSSGQVRVNGRDLLEEPLEIKRKIGYLPENPPLYQDLTVEEYLLYVARLKGLPEDHIPTYRDAVIAKTGLEKNRHRIIGELSLGYRKRTGIAQAIIHNPEIVILDEPISGLDPKQIIEIRNMINDLKRDHSFIISSHILGEVARTCDRFIFLHEGRLMHKATAGDLQGLMRRQKRLEVELVAREGGAPRSARELPGRLTGELDWLDTCQVVDEQAAGPDAAARVVLQLSLKEGRDEMKQADWLSPLLEEIWTADWELRSWQPVRLDLEKMFMESTQ